jgi:nucleotide-binding universal stress UspA family protein
VSSDVLTPPKKILVCVDGSETGFRAADFAMAIASGIRSELIFMNVVGASASEGEYNITADMVGSFEVLGMEALAKCEEKAWRNGLVCEKLQMSGDPSEEILKTATNLECDCIVVGRMHFDRAEKLLMGSVSDKVLKQSTVPVIIVNKK